MKCVVTAGPTYENLDEVRRLTNFSTGRLGSDLARFLEGQGHTVHLLLGYYATWRAEVDSKRTQIFTTTHDLRERLQAMGGDGIGAILHAAAVSDFGFGKIWSRDPAGSLHEVNSAKIPTRGGSLLAEWFQHRRLLANCARGFPALSSWAGSTNWSETAPPSSAMPNGKFWIVKRICASPTDAPMATVLAWSPARRNSRM